MMRTARSWRATAWLLTPMLALCGGFTRAQDVPGGAGPSAADSIPVNAHILVDQFGYRPADTKVAVIRTPKVGYDAADTFSPGPSYQLRLARDGKVVFSGAPASWNGGAVETSSGDAGWWFDFSRFTVPGSYFIYDVAQHVRSPVFSIDQHVYANALKAAVRMFFYQRSGSSTGGGAKRPPFADMCWSDGPAYVGPNQDTHAHDVADQANEAKAHDLSGGWFDAGDTNKYVTFATPTVHQLLTAYQNAPDAFTDDFNIPESGNGIPDILDEVKYELDWIKKMQFGTDGGVALKVGSLGFPMASPPSSDKTPRYYVSSCTSSTIAAAGMFAHAAYVYAGVPALAAEAESLKSRAISAWNYYQAAPSRQEHCDTGLVKSGNADWKSGDQQSAAVVAAVYLYAITGDPSYGSYVQQNYMITHPFHDIGWSRYFPQEGEALLFYATLPSADGALKNAILTAKLNDANAGYQVYGMNMNDDLYRSFLHDTQYHWGSNQVRGNYGNTNADVATYRIKARDAASMQVRALETLHYFHGVNPFGMVYLSNMKSYGATSSVNEIYHYWYAQGTKWSDARTSPCGPAPGYVPGGPVANAGNQGIPASLSPPVNQPAQKSYRDWNGVVGNAQNSWVVSEPGIYYQSAYVELVSRFAK